MALALIAFYELGIPASNLPAGGATTITGIATVIDGDTLHIAGQRVRLHGIDAPERGQTCKDAAGRDYACGQSATNALARKIAARPVQCAQRDVDSYGRDVSTCIADGIDLNEWIVNEGWALAYRRYSSSYVASERSARAAKRGLWSGTFTDPEDWRRK